MATYSCPTHTTSKAKKVGDKLVCMECFDIWILANVTNVTRTSVNPDSDPTVVDPTMVLTQNKIKRK